MNRGKDKDKEGEPIDGDNFFELASQGTQAGDSVEKAVVSATNFQNELKNKGYNLDLDIGYWFKSDSYFAFKPSTTTPNKAKVVWGYEVEGIRRSTPLDKAIKEEINKVGGLKSMPRLIEGSNIAVGFSIRYSSIDKVFEYAEQLGETIKKLIPKHLEDVSTEDIKYISNAHVAYSMQIIYQEQNKSKK